MLFNWHDVMAHRERCKDLQRDVESYRLTRLTLAGREKRDRFHCRVLIWLGRRMVAWGRRLQERYGTLVEAPAWQAANNSR